MIVKNQLTKISFHTYNLNSIDIHHKQSYTLEKIKLFYL